MMGRRPVTPPERSAPTDKAGDTTQFDVKTMRMAVAKLQPVVTVIKGLQVGKTVTLGDEELTIGRDASCDLSLIDRGISRNHARIERRNTVDAVIIDLKSTNGVRVNGDRVEECALSPGDKIQLGPETILTYRVEDPDEVATRIEQYERSIHDELTDIFNRRHFVTTLKRELAFVRRRLGTSGLILLDIDHFKQINDTHGHRTGDEVLIEIAKVLRSCTRRVDVLARWGGEEFALLARGMDLEQTRLAAERIRRKVERLTLDAIGHELHVTASCGVSLLRPGPEASVEHALEVADRCLYTAKRNGRNRVIFAPSG